MRTQITLYSDDSEWFEEIKERIAERRDGTEPSNAELLRLMMDQYDPRPDEDSKRL
jgi:hypothetical protein